MNNEKVISTKNIIVFLSLIMASMARIIFNVIVHAPSNANIYLGATAIVVLCAIGIAMKRKAKPTSIMYSLCLSMVIFTIVMMITYPNLATYLIIFYSLYVAALYEDIRAILTTGICDLFLSVYFFLRYQLIEYHSQNYQ